jgi:hypothetical protein
MNKIIYVAILGAGVYGAKKYLQSYANRQRFFDILDDLVSFIKKSINRGFDKDTSGNFSVEITEIFYSFEAAKRKSFETFFELQKALAEIKNIKAGITPLRLVPLKENYLNFNSTDENLELLKDFAHILSQADKLVNFTVINKMITASDNFDSLNETQIQFLLELVNLNNLVVNAISGTTLSSNGDKISEQTKRAFERLKVAVSQV